MINILKITADDFGYSKERNNGIERAINCGIVNSVSVLVNGSSLDMPQTLLTSKGVRIGLHLNLTEGKPVTKNLLSIRTLLDEHNEFFTKLHFTDKLQYFSELEVNLTNNLIFNFNEQNKF